MKTRSAKAKGRRLQNAVAAALRHLFGLTKEDVHPAIMGESGIDIKLSTAARRPIPYALECKNVEKVNVWDAIKQAEANAAKEKLDPAVVLFRNHMHEPYVAIPWRVFYFLIFKAYKTPIIAPAAPAFRDYMKKAEEEDQCPTSTTE